MIRSLFQRQAQAPRDDRPPPRVPDGQRVYVIGDIHGCADLLQTAHEQIEADAQDNAPDRVKIIYLGDYIDRGTSSYETLELLTTPGPANFDRVFLKGNHEVMLESFLLEPETGASWRHYGGMETLQSYRVDIHQGLAQGGLQALAEEFRDKIPSTHLEFFQQLLAATEIGDYFFCHAGVRPGTPLERQREDDLLWIRREFLTSDENFGKIVVHGHTVTELPEFRPNRINIDTGAYMSGTLTCLVLESDNQRIIYARR
ncbi:MAG: metallophosphoesterase family protein [Pseudomonadota bacterium]